MGKGGYPLPGSLYPPLPAPSTTTVAGRTGSKYDPYADWWTVSTITSWERAKTAKAFFREQRGDTKSGTRHVRRYGHYLQSFGAKPEGTATGWNAFARGVVPWASGALTSAAIGGVVHSAMWRPAGALGGLSHFERLFGQSAIALKTAAFWAGYGAASWGVGSLLAFGSPSVSAWGSGFSFAGRLGAAIRLASDLWAMASYSLRALTAPYATSWRGVSGGSVGRAFIGSGHATFAPFPTYY